MLNTNSLNCVIVAKHIRTLYTAYMLCDDSKLENVTVVTQSVCLLKTLTMIQREHLYDD